MNVKIRLRALPEDIKIRTVVQETGMSLSEILLETTKKLRWHI